MSDPSCHDLIKASGNFIARCFQEPIGCVADDRIDCENGCMLKLAYKAGKDEAAALIERLQKELKEARDKTIDDCCRVLQEAADYHRQKALAADPNSAAYAVGTSGAGALLGAMDAIRSIDGGGK